MYPKTTLTELAAAKVLLRQSISRRRAACVEAAAIAAQPLQWIDTARELWRSAAPFARLAAWPLGAFAAGGILPLPKIIGRLLRWAPSLVSVFSALRQRRREGQAAPAES